MDTGQATCSKVPCEHWESNSPAFWGHCSHGSCPNYMDSCSVHAEYMLGARRG